MLNAAAKFAITCSQARANNAVNLEKTRILTIYMYCIIPFHRYSLVHITCKSPTATQIPYFALLNNTQLTSDC